MAIDPEVGAEITAIKNKLLKLETDLTGLSGKEWSEAKKEISSLRSDLSDLLKIKKDPPPVPPTKKEDDPVETADPLNEFIESGKV